MRNVIVTGANGFIGSAVTNYLANCGIRVFALVRNAKSDTSRIDSSDKIKIIECDLLDFNNLQKSVGSEEIDVFFHFAWSGVSDNSQFDYRVQIKNITLSCNSVAFCILNHIKTFIFASSLWEYECHHLMASKDPVKLSALYSCSKIAADYMCRTLCNSNGIAYRAGIITNAYGEGDLSSRLISTTIFKLLRKEKTEFTSATQSYDFIHIKDLARAFYAIADRGIDNKSYYLGSLNPRKLRIFLEEIRNLIDPTLDLGIGMILTPGVHLDYSQFSIFELTEDTGYKPEISFKEGIIQYINWLKENNKYDCK